MPLRRNGSVWREKKEGYVTLQCIWQRSKSLAEKQLFHVSPIQSERLLCQF